MIADRERLLDDVEFRRRLILVVRQCEEESFVRRDEMVGLDVGLAPRYVRQAAANLAAGPLRNIRGNMAQVNVTIRTRHLSGGLKHRLS